MVRSFDEFLKCLNDQLTGSPIDLRDFPQRLTVALFWQELQLARMVSIAVLNGYGGETPLLTRPILSAAANIIYIAKADSQIRAWWYQLSLEETEQNRIDRLEQYGVATPAEVQAARQTHGAKWARAHAEAQALNLPDVPQVDAPLVAGTPGMPSAIRQGATARRTWSRLSDRALFIEIGKPDWYDIHYAVTSDESHVNAAAVVEYLGNIGAGRPSEVGPQESPSWSRLALQVAIDAISESLLAMDKRWSLGIQASVQTCRDGASDGVVAHHTQP